MRPVIILLAFLWGCGGGGDDYNYPKLVGYQNFQLGNIVLSRPFAEYEYAPTIIKDSGVYKAWWCARRDDMGGDTILQSHSNSLHTGWSQPTVAISPSLVPGQFDKNSVCDPSVVMKDGVYYMYYGGLNMEKTIPTNPQIKAVTEIGVATSTDGIHWSRKAEPIVSPVRPDLPAQYPADWVKSHYGAGQPSVIFKDGYFYMLFHDSTGYVYETGGQGSYLIRSKSPLFDAQEVFVGEGFEIKSEQNYTRTLLHFGVSLDWVYSPELDSYIIGYSGKANNTVLYGLDTSFTEYVRVDVPGVQWTEGIGIVRNSVGWLDSNLFEFIFPTGGITPFEWDMCSASFEIVGE